MRRYLSPLRSAAEAVAAAMMATMFATFILQVTVRYTSRLDWVATHMPFLDAANFGWTLEFCLALWVWLVFWGNAFVVREHEHVTFDLLALSVSPGLRRVFAIVAGLAIAAGLLLSVAPTWDRFAILGIKRTATLSDLFGDWIRMRDIYVVYILFLFAVAARYLWKVWRAFRHGVEDAGSLGDAQVRK